VSMIRGPCAEVRRRRRRASKTPRPTTGPPFIISRHRRIRGYSGAAFMLGISAPTTLTPRVCRSRNVRQWRYLAVPPGPTGSRTPNDAELGVRWDIPGQPTRSQRVSRTTPSSDSTPKVQLLGRDRNGEDIYVGELSHFAARHRSAYRIDAIDEVRGGLRDLLQRSTQFGTT